MRYFYSSASGPIKRATYLLRRSNSSLQPLLAFGPRFFAPGARTFSPLTKMYPFFARLLLAFGVRSYETFHPTVSSRSMFQINVIFLKHTLELADIEALH